MNHKINIFWSLGAAFVLYSFFVYTYGTQKKIPGNFNSNITEGKLLFQKYNCISCHQLYGLGGYLGPELTTVISQKGENYAKVFIQNGTLRMPNFQFSEKEINALIEYLKYVDSSAETYKLSNNK